MKKRACAAVLLLALCVALGSPPVRAEGLWSEDYYRASDASRTLSEAERNSLDEDCLSFMKKYRADLVLLAVQTRSYANSTLREAAEEYYADCGFGYGDGHDGFLWVYVIDENRVEVFCFGAAEGMIARDYLDDAAASAPELAEKHGVFGVLSGGVKYLSDYMEQQADAGSAERVGEGSSMPSWYPADPKGFPSYHDEDAPRVVDEADIFTDAEELRLESRIGEIRRELRRDIVVYTDRSDYGLGKKICAADFYDFNGYGYGDEREGVCLFIDMDPDDRGWWCCCTGSETMGLYTEESANLIDDVLYEYMASGAYADGVADWIENIRTMYVKGVPFAPEWYPNEGEALTPFHDPDAPRVVDDAGLLTEAELAALTEQAARVAGRNGVDVAIHTMPSPYGMSYAEVGRLYYIHMGYGYGDDYDGIILNVFKREGYLATARIAAFGSAADRLSETNEQRLRGFCEDKTDDYKYYEAMSQWLDQVDHMERTGRVPRSAAYWVFISLLSLLVGSIFGAIQLGGAKRKMAPPREKRDADAYIDSAGSRIRDAGRAFLYTTTSRRYDPVKKESSGGGGSSGRSSYSRSYSGSSGRSHSGSGRSF